MPIFDLQTGKCIGMPNNRGSMVFEFNEKSGRVNVHDTSDFYGRTMKEETEFFKKSSNASSSFEQKHVKTPKNSEKSPEVLAAIAEKKKEKNKKKKDAKKAKKLAEKAENPENSGN
ncbi:hypothetical protein B9Z55_027098 [Caenorhabditis nigoni]|nr:hypothetical protein B9Z55_027098 [Caenorhabditis nigoni]